MVKDTAEYDDCMQTWKVMLALTGILVILVQFV